MSQYRVAALTDHSGHSAENSIYAILTELARHEHVSGVEVVSRGLEENRKFFEGDIASSIKAMPVDGAFSYDSTGQQYENSRPINLDDCDIILMRLPRPITDAFLNELDRRFGDKLIINKPAGILETSSKAFLLNFQDLCPPIALCRTVQDIVDFSQRYDLVLKPLKEYGGKGILRIKNGMIHDGQNEFAMLPFLQSQKEYIQTEGYLAMKYLENVKEGDKRLLVVDGEVLASSLRLPASGSWLCNVAQGGESVSSEPDADEIEMVDMIHPVMKRWGVMIYGVDTLVGDDSRRVLSEINTMSIGGFMQAQEQTGRPVIRIMLDKIIKYADERYRK